MNKNSIWSRYFKSSEEIISMFLGLVIVIVVVALIFNYFQRRRGSVDLSGVTDQKITQTVTPTAGLKVVGESGQKLPVFSGSEYVVKKNDSLWKIAQARYGSGYNWVDIAKSNKLNNPGLLSEGAKLILPDVPKREVVTKATTSNVITTDTYTVVKGDSLWKIAVRKYSDGYRWVDIWKENKAAIFDPNKLEIGMSLTLPALK